MSVNSNQKIYKIKVKNNLNVRNKADKFWGITAAPVQSSLTWGVRLAYPPVVSQNLPSHLQDNWSHMSQDILPI